MTDKLELRWKPPGPICDAFVRDRSLVAGIMGPFGSGKTSGALVKAIMLACDQAPFQGVRRARVAAIRDTYPNLRKTTLATWHAWVPRDLGRYVDEAPALHQITFRLPDQTLVELEMQFIALGEHRVEDVMRGWEGTGAYLNEADRMEPDVLTYVLGRVGRYPPTIMGGCTRRAVWLDFNAPDTDSWLYDRFVDGPKPGERLYVQPGGLDAGAENLGNLPGDYYEGLVAANPAWWVRRFVHNRWGASREGKPVYPEFDDTRHVAPRRLDPVRGLRLVWGIDGGATPAGVLAQPMPSGQWRFLAEIVTPPEATCGPTAFGEAINRVMAEPRFAGWPRDDVTIWGDPATAKGGDRDQPWLGVVRHTTKLLTRPAPTNDPQLRIEAVRVPLTRSGEGGAPMLLIGPDLRWLRKGFNSHYRYRRIQVGEGRWSDEPDKNPWSHVHDAAQYVMVGGGEHLEVLGRARAKGRPVQLVAREE